MAKPESLAAVVAAAIADLEQHGNDNDTRVAYWQERIERAARASMTSRQKLDAELKRVMHAVYKRMVEREGVLTKHPGVARFTLSKVRPELRAELDRRIYASANLIKLNREKEILTTLQRFAGWASSIPAGGTTQADKKSESTKIRKAVAGLPFTERRVLIDQGHKLEASISNIVAVGGGAIAAIWRSHFHQAGYDYREDHKDRELESERLPYLIRGSWALEKGLIKLGGSKYLDQMTQPGEEVFCRCYLRYIYSPRKLPDDQLTAKGREALKAAEAAR